MLKRLGLPLSRIAKLLSGCLASPDALLELQEQTLARESGDVAYALSLVRAARAKLAQGESLSIGDLTNPDRGDDDDYQGHARGNKGNF